MTPEAPPIQILQMATPALIPKVRWIEIKAVLILATMFDSEGLALDLCALNWCWAVSDREHFIPARALPSLCFQ